jgi:hypothetical protein
MDSWDLYRTDLFNAHIVITGGFTKPMNFKPPITITITITVHASY